MAGQAEDGAGRAFASTHGRLLSWSPYANSETGFPVGARPRPNGLRMLFGGWIGICRDPEEPRLRLFTDRDADADRRADPRRRQPKAGCAPRVGPITRIASRARSDVAYGAGGYALEPRRNPGGLTAALSAYFNGALERIDHLPVAAAGTPFQRKVWKALRAIPCGTTLSYSELARRIGRPASVRAVGHANGANPVGVVVPCHRLVGRDGSLTGYGGGISRKRWLLAHEASAAPRAFASKARRRRLTSAAEGS